jgi:hypothetical protein
MGMEIFAQAEMFNIFDEGEVADSRFINTTVTTRRTGGAASGLVAFNPKTETPVEGTHYRLSPSFGQPTSFSAYQQARTYQFSLGLRF